MVVGLAVPAQAAQLTLGEGVVLKFGADAQLIVRDRIAAQRDVRLTSERDSAVAGVLQAGMSAPAAGDWAGVRLEKSANAFGLTFADVWIRYAGANQTAALTLRGTNASLPFLRVSDNAVGVHVQGGAPTLDGLWAVRNGIALTSDGLATPQIHLATIAGNQQGVVNHTPEVTVLATNTWWGNPSGPKNAQNHPQGRGDSVSAGVDASQFLAAAPLTNPSVRLAQGASLVAQRQVRLLLSCANATAYRVAELGGLTTTAFSAMPEEGADIDFMLSADDGPKSVVAEFRDAGGRVVGATLASGIQLDRQPPTLALVQPAQGSILSGQTTVIASAQDGSGITQVQFDVNGALAHADQTAPYEFAWDTDQVAEGTHRLVLRATDGAGRTTEAQYTFEVVRSVVGNDTDPPLASELKLGATAWSEGATVAENTTLMFMVSDRSGLASAQLLIDGQLVSGLQSGGGTGLFSLPLAIDSLANGPKTMTLRLADTASNTVELRFGIVIAHALPDVPSLVQPESGFVTRAASVAVSGTAALGAQVQLYLNGAATGAPLPVESNGTFTATLVLAQGVNRIQAQTLNTWGASALSPEWLVTYDTRALPVAPTQLAAWPQMAGQVKLTWLRSTDPNVVGYDVYRANAPFDHIAHAQRVNAQPLAAQVNGFDDAPPTDGTYYYRVVARDSAGVVSAPSASAQVQSDHTAPRATTIVYESLGQFDAQSGSFGQGAVKVSLTVSEPLAADPYLALTFDRAAPIVVALAQQGPLQYVGGFDVGPTSPSGVATAIFSARDGVGNRGTDIDAGRSIAIDAQGPVVTQIVLAPSAPLRADNAPEVTATFEFSEPLKNNAPPELKYVLSGPLRTPVALAQLTQVSPTVWRANWTLPADAGLAGAEFLAFQVRAFDALNNVSTQINAPNHFQVYQGHLPPAQTPTGLTAHARPAGQVQLAWDAVTEAAAYQVYRQAPGESTLTVLTRADSNALLDAPAVEGLYRYSVASVRAANGQETESAQSAPVDVTTLVQAPGAPEHLTLDLIGQGIRARWQAPVGGAASYNLYRSDALQIDRIDGLLPLRTGIAHTEFIDADPSASGSAYVVTALDAAGNESAVSNSAYLNASLLPVRTLNVEHNDDAMPVLSWTAPAKPVAGYHVDVTVNGARVRLTTAPISTLSFTDTGYAGGAREYTVSSVDSHGVEMPRSVVLPAVDMQMGGGLPLRRGVMNRLHVQVSNPTAQSVSQARVRVQVGSVDHLSEPLTLGPNETRMVPVVVGGYHDLRHPTPLILGLDIQPNVGERVQRSRSISAEVADGALAIRLITEQWIRGGKGQVRIVVENTSDVEVELLTARNNGSAPSDEVRFKLLDTSGHVLATQSLLQAMGANLMTLTNGSTVARIAPGATYTSEPFFIFVPADSPDLVQLALEIDRLRYKTGEPEAIVIQGRGAQTQIALADVRYIGEITSVTPAVSYGDQPIRIGGRAIDRISGVASGHAILALVINQEGYERRIEVNTNSAGEFTHVYTPQAGDAGLYAVGAVHPQIFDRPAQRSFVINRVRITPSWKVSVPPNYSYTIPLQLAAGAGTQASQLQLQLNAGSQPNGQLPEGIVLTLPAALDIAQRQTLTVPVQFSANNNAARKGVVILDLVEPANSVAPIGQVRIEYVLTEAKPFLVATPNVISTGLAQGHLVIEPLVLENKGVLALNDLQLTLTQTDGSPAPDWLTLASPAQLGTLNLGDRRTVQIHLAPPAQTPEGI